MRERQTDREIKTNAEQMNKPEREVLDTAFKDLIGQLWRQALIHIITLTDRKLPPRTVRCSRALGFKWHWHL